MMLRAVALVVSLSLALLLNGRARVLHAAERESLVPSATLVHWLSAPVRQLTVDLYWIRMVGVSTDLSRPYQGLGLIRWGQFVTDLEPTFYWGYAMGGLLGAVQSGATTYNVPEAVALYEKGISNLPHDARLPVFLAFLQLETQRDPAAAAKTLQRAAAIEGAPAFIGQLATRLLASTGQLDAARVLAQSIVERGGDEAEFFTERLAQIEDEAFLQQVDAAVERFTARQSRPPAGLDELLASGELDALKGNARLADVQLTADGARLPTVERLRPHRPRQ